MFYSKLVAVFQVFSAFFLFIIIDSLLFWHITYAIYENKLDWEESNLPISLHFLLTILKMVFIEGKI